MNSKRSAKSSPATQIPASGARPARGFNPSEHERRLRALMRTLKRQRLDGALIAGAVARFYYTGLTASNGLLLVDAREGPLFLTDFRYIVAARKALPFLQCAQMQSNRTADSTLRRHTANWRRCGYEGSQSYAVQSKRQTILDAIREWMDIDPLITAQRAIKSKAEQQAMRRAIAANDRMLANLTTQIRPGMSEWELRMRLRREADCLGQGEAFDSIVCFGANAAECHHQSGDTRLRRNQSILIDCGLRLDHYCSDMTRCLAFGTPPKTYRALHETVLEANRRAIAALRPGMRGAEVDAVAREFLASEGFDKEFGHGLGHGLGLEVHEAPSFSPGCDHPILPGMIMTIEPGLYLPGRSGVRIEDVVLVTNDGCEVLSSSPRDIRLKARSMPSGIPPRSGNRSSDRSSNHRVP